MARAVLRLTGLAMAAMAAGLLLGAAWIMYRSPLMSILGSTVNFCG